MVGAGIGGLASAIALARGGWEATVFEVTPEHRPLGAGLSLWSNGVRALRWLGLGKLVEESLHQAGGVRRAELHEALLAGCGPERVRLGNGLGAVELGGGGDPTAGAELRFEDGTVERADLVVGADGLRSAVRASLLGDGQPRDAGIVAYRGVAPVAGEVAAGEWWGIGSVAGLLPLRGGRAYWYFGAFGEDRPGRIDELVAGYEPRVGEVVAAEPDVGAALAAYERARVARGALFVKESRRAAAIALPRPALVRRLRDTLLPLTPEAARLRQFARFLDWTP